MIEEGSSCFVEPLIMALLRRLRARVLACQFGKAKRESSSIGGSLTTEIRKTNCHYCGYLCAFDATVVDGVVTELTPDPTRYPYDVKTVQRCRRWRMNIPQLYNENRVNYPLRRVGKRGGGEFERVSWDEAIGDISTRLKAW